MNNLPIKEFLIGGLTIGGIKYASDNIDDIRVAALVGNIPVILMSSIMIKDNKVKGFLKAYMTNVFILFFLASILYYIHGKYNTDYIKNLACIMIIWIIINIGLFYF
jgi:hypothetical protein